MKTPRRVDFLSGSVSSFSHLIHCYLLLLQTDAFVCDAGELFRVIYVWRITSLIFKNLCLRFQIQTPFAKSVVASSVVEGHLETAWDISGIHDPLPSSSIISRETFVHQSHPSFHGIRIYSNTNTESTISQREETPLS